MTRKGRPSEGRGCCALNQTEACEVRGQASKPLSALTPSTEFGGACLQGHPQVHNSLEGLRTPRELLHSWFLLISVNNGVTLSGGKRCMGGGVVQRCSAQSFRLPGPCGTAARTTIRHDVANQGDALEPQGPEI